MATIKSWADWRTEARIETRANAVLIVLQARGIAVSDAARERILAQKDLELLQCWLVKASVASSVGDVLDNAS